MRHARNTFLNHNSFIVLVNKLQKAILKQLEKIVNRENQRLPKSEEAYITDCNVCGAILVSSKVVMGRRLAYFGNDEIAHDTIGLMMCINCKFVNEQKIMINDEKLRQLKKEAI